MDTDPLPSPDEWTAYPAGGFSADEADRYAQLVERTGLEYAAVRQRLVAMRPDPASTLDKVLYDQLHGEAAKLAARWHRLGRRPSAGDRPAEEQLAIIIDWLAHQGDDLAVQCVNVHPGVYYALLPLLPPDRLGRSLTTPDGRGVLLYSSSTGDYDHVRYSTWPEDGDWRLVDTSFIPPRECPASLPAVTLYTRLRSTGVRPDQAALSVNDTLARRIPRPGAGEPGRVAHR